MSDYAERFKANKTIDVSNSSSPKFPGRMIMFNGNTGNMSLIVPGQDVSTAQDIKSVRMVVDFTMKRLKYKQGNEKDEISNYIIQGETTPYKLTVFGTTYTGRTKREIVEQMNLSSDDSLKQQVIYVGYMIQIDGKNCETAEPVWYVSRGTNDYLLNDELKAIDGLKPQTLITLLANGENHKNVSGGTNKVITFDVHNMTPEKADGFADWVTKDGATDLIAEYREKMLAISDKAPVEHADTNDGQFNANQEVDIADDDLPF